MLQRLAICFLVFLSGWAASKEELAPTKQGRLPWMGMTLKQPEPEQRKLAKLKPGVGLFISEVVPTGPAALSGVQAGDFLVKFGDQWIINRSQLVVLLRIQKPGDQITLEFNRKGESFSKPLTLKQWPSLSPTLQAPIPSRILDRKTQEAELSHLGQDFVLKETEGKLSLHVTEGEKSIFIGDVTLPASQSKLPKEWQKPLQVLRQTILERKPPEQKDKTPRKVRYIPHSSQNSN